MYLKFSSVLIRSGCLVDPKIVHLVFEILEVFFKVETEGRLQDF